MSRKPEKTTEDVKKKRLRKRKTKQTITRAVTHIRLSEANPGKLAALDQMMAVYLPLCQAYTTLFCTQEANPDKYTAQVFETNLSDRLHRVAIQQAAGIATSWRTNRQAAYETYLEDLADYTTAKAQAQAEGRALAPKRKEPDPPSPPPPCFLTLHQLTFDYSIHLTTPTLPPASFQRSIPRPRCTSARGSGG